MTVDPAALAALSAAVAAETALAAWYLARVRMPRPPVGVYTGGDIAVLCAGVVLAPLLYTALPAAAVSAVFGLVACLAVQFTLAPLLAATPLRATPWSWAAALTATAATALAALTGHPAAARAGSDLMIATAVVGVANLWTQSGLRSGHTAALAAVLTGYDLAATTLTATTTRFFEQVQDRPFAPLLALTGGPAPVAVGLGDLLLLVLYPLVAAKAHGRTAATVAALVGLLTTSTVSACFAAGWLTSGFPLLTALGPLIVAQHLYWRRRTGGERTTAQWREGHPLPLPLPSSVGHEPAAALAAPVPDGTPPGTWLALADGRVLGAGPTPGHARRDARRHGTDTPTTARLV
ncbi:hypothetical protein DR950_00690 [Kitasatospora xanthocidica]|uniref:Uncharacterized protein n=1 Tax=Kitasatospora xanthocidica TaxID=83382 RepID=A0A372ZLQ8_9ACTN|nr:hypothetical protein [Kitasatospora xanthocidica]RGD56504.1 hypothetical protein DR950_00690 [Kitasatospora xanthocidica]